MHRLTNARYLTALVTAGLLAVGTLASAGSASAPTSPQNVWVISGVTVGVPLTPDDGRLWDAAITGILLGNLKRVQPDVLVCMESAHVPESCMAICWNAVRSEERDAYVCAQPTGPSGLLFEKNLHVVVHEVVQEPEPGSKRLVADFKVEDPAECTPCTLSTLGGTLWIQFDFAEVDSYTGPFRAKLGRIPPPSTLPVATPSSGGSAPSSPAQPPTVAEVEQALRDLRDADNCVGPDQYFPQGTTYGFNQMARLGPGLEKVKLYYQMAAFAMALCDPSADCDPTAKQANQLVMEKIKKMVEDGAPGDFEFVMPLILADVSRSKELLDAFQNSIKQFASMIAAKFIPSGQSAIALMYDIKRGIFKKLTTDPLASRAVDLMFTDRKISAECAFNQLAKEEFLETEGFIKTIGTR